MNMTEKTFHRCREEKRNALIGYITGGDPNPDESFKILDAVCAAGVDILELGIPFSDATADGPVIQRASHRALCGGSSVATCLQLGGRLRKRHLDKPIILFGYYNPILAYGPKRFVMDAIETGLNGVLCVDLPAEHFDEIRSFVPEDQAFDLITLIAPTTTPERMAKILPKATGFVYIQSRSGVTGIRTENVPDSIDALQKQAYCVREKTNIPTAIGFGISNASQAGVVAPFCDGVVVGSALVRLIEKYIDPKTGLFNSEDAVQELTGLVQSLRLSLNRS